MNTEQIQQNAESDWELDVSDVEHELCLRGERAQGETLGDILWFIIGLLLGCGVAAGDPIPNLETRT